MPRPRCSSFIAESLDGFIARPNGGLDWLDPMHGQGEDYGFQAFYGGVDAVVTGRNTYDVVLGFPSWSPDKRMVVLTHRPAAPREGVAFFSGAPEALVERLGAEGVRHAYVDGGAVVTQFLRAGLLDDLTVSVIPVVLGDGIRLFQGGLPERPLALRSSRSFPTGLVQLSYDLG